MDELINFIKKYTPLDSETESAIKNKLFFESYSKNDFLLKPGQICSKLYFIKSGMIKKYFIYNDKEMTKWIHCEGEMATSLGSFKRLPSDEYLQASEDTTAIVLNYSDRQELTNNYPQIERFGRLILEDQLSLLDATGKRFNLMTAREKYDFMMLIAPKIFQRARLGDIATLLGITQETLSRIRSVR